MEGGPGKLGQIRMKLRMIKPLLCRITLAPAYAQVPYGKAFTISSSCGELHASVEDPVAFDGGKGDESANTM